MTRKFDRVLPVGAYCDLVTPFSDGTVDTDAIERLVKWQIANGITGLVVCGLAGEATSLTWAERRAVVKAAVVAAAGRVPVLVGTGTTSTVTTLANTMAARELGADAALIVTPYYNKPSQKGLLHHFGAVTSVVDIPILICNAPSLTASNVLADTIEQLATIPGIVGVVDCTGDVAGHRAALQVAGSHLRYMSGDDQTSLFYNLTGGSGTVSIAANIAPRLVVGLHDALRSDDLRTAQSLHAKLCPLYDLIDQEPPAAVVKHALHRMHGLNAETRLPLIPIEQSTVEALRDLLDTLPRHAGVSAFITL